jgi:hypothetical protein
MAAAHRVSGHRTGARCVAPARAWPGISIGLLCLWLALGPWGCQRESPGQPAFGWRSTCAQDSVGVGDPIHLAIEGQWPADRGALHLAWGASADTLLLAARDSTAAAAPEGWEARRYQLTALAARAGRIAIPPGALVSAQGETLALTAAHTVRVGGRINAPEQAKLRPLAPLASLRGFPYLAVVLCVAGLAILAAALLLWRRRRSEALGPPAPPPIRPEVEFQDGLEALLGRRLREEGRMRAFTQELSWILRRYLGRRWQHPALEATRPEIVRWLPHTEMSVADQQAVAGWLETTDRIKFAGAVPLLAETDALVEQARQVVSRGQQLAAERRRREEEAQRAAGIAAEAGVSEAGGDQSRAADGREGR